VKDTVNGMNELQAKIRNLEAKQAYQLEEIKLSYGLMIESITPANMVKSSLKNIIATPGLRSTLLDTAVSLGAGFIGRKVIVRGSGNIFRKLAGIGIQFLVTNLVRNKMPEIKEKSAELIEHKL